MPQNDFLPFGLDVDANVLSQAEYAALAARTGGFSSGKAASAELNKVWRQSAFMTAALAKAVYDTLGVDVLDDGDLPSMAALIDDYVNDLIAAAGGGGGGGGGFALLEQKTANFNAVSGHAYEIKGAGITATLPGAPAYGDRVRFIGNFSVNNATIGRNGNSIAGAAANLVLNQDNIGPTLYWVAGTTGWAVTP
jgi:hypothetical protein